MKIKFNDGREYKVFSVTYQMDENNVAIDIIIYGTKEVLEQIAEYASIGVNIQECNWESALQSGMWTHYADHVCVALYARLQSFTVIDAGTVHFVEDIDSSKLNY